MLSPSGLSNAAWNILAFAIPWNIMARLVMALSPIVLRLSDV